MTISTTNEDKYVPHGRLLFFVPVVAFAGIAVAFAIGLTLNPQEIPSALIGKEVPEFALPPVKGRALSLSSTDLKGEILLVNVFASWCVECRAEHPLLMKLSREGTVPIHGLNYKDQPDDAANWLDTLGDPYTRTGADLSGRVAIDWGVYGVPETFVVDRNGTIIHKHIGALTQQSFDAEIRSLIDQLESAE
ncbi:MAG: DsbE family thiol:disulfide interchange protein [Rhodospirillales bacterium]|nr:DsbE family thiol:disulfide interchange protein [Rhodospirillales bacterium]MBT4626339.1 DsbE family thiol:disulfide interchange protein [Rhodospirillales bacterium]MBT5352948.1 DsbE family thiol:disulfide interchange protein [Rhodospirillales bacterium]